VDVNEEVSNTRKSVNDVYRRARAAEIACAQLPSAMSLFGHICEIIAQLSIDRA
jgi:hypothetical protein